MGSILPEKLEQQLSGGFAEIADFIQAGLSEYELNIHSKKQMARSYGWYNVAGQLVLIRPVKERFIKKQENGVFQVSFDLSLREKLFAIILYNEKDCWVLPKSFLKAKTERLKGQNVAFRTDYIEKYKNDFSPFLSLAKQKIQEENSPQEKPTVEEVKKKQATKALSEKPLCIEINEDLLFIPGHGTTGSLKQTLSIEINNNQIQLKVGENIVILKKEQGAKTTIKLSC